MTWNGINITSRSKEKGDFALVKDTNSNEFHEKILSWIQKLKFKKKVFILMLMGQKIFLEVFI